MEPPAGTVALLFTDIEGSTALAAALGEEWPASLAVHHEVVGGAILAHGGYVDRTEGDAFFAVFADPSAAVAAAVDAQRGLAARDRRLRVRMGLHAGHVERRATGYVGLEIHRAARVAAAAHGGQILLTDVIVTLARGAVETEDLGEHRLKDFPLPERLHCAVVGGVGASAFPPPRTLAIRPTNLPADDRLLLGREAELDAIVASFAAGDRLVTLTGMGGTGKTRLALAAGGTLLDAHPGGVWWVPLAGASGDDAVLSAVAAAVRVHDDGSRPVREAIAARIGSRPTLTVVDNLEHLPAAGPELAGLLALAPGLRVLATSQLPLRVGAEHVLALEPLRATAAIELLRRLGERARPGLQLDDELAGELCERLGHLPLAVELAAARLAVLTPSQLLQRLASPLALLKGGGHDTPARQRSLRATIEWTLGLLDDDPRELFRRLGVFAGAVELEDVEAVCGDGGFDVVDAVSALLDAGLLRRIEDGSGVIRFRLPEPLRQVAEERLDATPDGTALRGSHAAHVARAAWPGSRAFVSTMAEFARTSALQRDVLAALAWSRVHDRALVPLLAACRASWLWDAGPLAEPLALATEVLAVPEAEPDAAAHALLVLASIRGRLGARDEQIALTRRAADIPDASIEAHVQALGDLALAQAHESPGDARASDAAAWEAAQRSGSAHVLAGAAYGRAQLHVALEEPEAAATALDLAAELAAAADLTGAGWIDTVRADVHLQLAEYEDAGRLYVRSMETAWAAGEVGQLYNDLHTTARALAGAGRAEDALEVHGMAVAQGEEMGIGVGELHQFDDEQPIAAAHAALPRDVAEAAIARGRAVPLERRIDRARELAGSPARQP